MTDNRMEAAMATEVTGQRKRLHGITGMTDNLRPVVAGKAKIGEIGKSSRGKEIPKKLDYIKFVDGKQHKIEAVHDILGDRPTEFVAVFPSNNPDEFWWEIGRAHV